MTIKKQRQALLPGAFLVGPVGIEPTTKRLCIPLQLSLPRVSLWAGLSLRPGGAPAV